MLILLNCLYEWDRSASDTHRVNLEPNGFYWVPTATGQGAPGGSPAATTTALWHLAFQTRAVAGLLSVAGSA